MEVDPDYIASVIRAPRRGAEDIAPSAKRRRVERLVNVEPVVVRKRGRGVKRGSGIRVTMRKRLQQARKQLRLAHNAAKKAYRKRYAKLTSDIRQLGGRRTQREAYMA